MYPEKILVMGVSGCGKTTLATALAKAMGADLIEGDDYHLPASQDKMSRGIPLQDEDRWPWLDRLGAVAARSRHDLVFSCSALKRAYRDRLRSAVPSLRIIYVAISPSAAVARVGSRPDHLFPASLVANQFETLEDPQHEAQVLTVSAGDSTGEQVEQILQWLSQLSEQAAQQSLKAHS